MTARARTLALLRPVAAAAAGAALLAGCSGSVSVSTGSTTLDDAKAVEAITKNIQDQVGADVKVDITCPKDVPMASGGTFACTGTVAGQAITIDVTQKDADGNVSYSSQEALISLPKAEAAISDDATKQNGGTFTTSCPKPASGSEWLVVKPSATFDCTVTDGTQMATVTVTVKDSEGNITWAVKS